MSLPKIQLENQFGEFSDNWVIASDGGLVPASEVADGTVIANISGDVDFPSAVTLSDLSDVLLPSMLLTGYVSGAGVVAATDTVLESIQKLNGNIAATVTVANAALPSASFTSAAVTAKVLTGLAAGANSTILSTDTILVALAKLQAQIDALA